MIMFLLVKKKLFNNTLYSSNLAATFYLGFLKLFLFQAIIEKKSVQRGWSWVAAIFENILICIADFNKTQFFKK